MRSSDFFKKSLSSFVTSWQHGVERIEAKSSLPPCFPTHLPGEDVSALKKTCKLLLRLLGLWNKGIILVWVLKFALLATKTYIWSFPQGRFLQVPWRQNLCTQYDCKRSHSSFKIVIWEHQLLICSSHLYLIHEILAYDISCTIYLLIF